MANNRLYIRCKCCKEKTELFLGKHFEGGWYIGDYIDDYNRPFGEVINEFHDKHIECFYKWHDNPYEIITENDWAEEERMKGWS